MSPVERSRGHAGRALAVSGVAIAVVALVLWGVATFASNQSSLDIGLGDQTFQGGSAERLAGEIDDGGPILYGDVSGEGQSRPIFLQHVGDDVNEGWYAILAFPPDKDADCAWEWDSDDGLFRAACDPDLTAPADGEGLERYPVEVVDGKLDVDLNDADRTTTTGSTTTVIESGEVPSTTSG